MSGIVIIEEDKLMRSLLVEWLSAEGYRVSTANGSGEATGDPDVVIVDLYMPRHAGSSTMRSVQSAYPGVPVIAISGQFRSGLAADGTAAKALGAQQVIAKPFGRAELVAAVRTVIRSPV